MYLFNLNVAATLQVYIYTEQVNNWMMRVRAFSSAIYCISNRSRYRTVSASQVNNWMMNVRVRRCRTKKIGLATGPEEITYAAAGKATPKALAANRVVVVGRSSSSSSSSAAAATPASSSAKQQGGGGASGVAAADAMPLSKRRVAQQQQQQTKTL